MHINLSKKALCNLLFIAELMPLIDVSPQRVIIYFFFLEMLVTHLKNVSDVCLIFLNYLI
jgi:hypothetical protein